MNWRQAKVTTRLPTGLYSPLSDPDLSKDVLVGEGTLKGDAILEEGRCVLGLRGNTSGDPRGEGAVPGGEGSCTLALLFAGSLCGPRVGLGGGITPSNQNVVVRYLCTSM